MCDIELGRVLTSAAHVLSCGLRSYRVDESQWTHLESSQRQKLLQLLDEFHDRFTDTPGLCDATVHRILTN